MIIKKYIQNYNVEELASNIKKFVPNNKSNIVLICIGTNKIIGDCVGPLVGSILNKFDIPNIYGTLNSPVHALNIKNVIEKIYYEYNNPFVIAIDASLGNYNNIGNITISNKFLSPGTAIRKALPKIGDISITGIVNNFSLNGYFQLEHCKPSIVANLSYAISKSIVKSLKY